MLTKILFTVAVIIIVLLVYQVRARPSTAQARRAAATAKQNKSGRWAIYFVAGILVVAASVVFFFKWQDDNTEITIRVVTGQENQISSYKALRKNIKDKGRTFTTLDGRLVTLGDSDRSELLEN